MKKKFFLIIILITFLVSASTLVLILNYLDPFKNELLSSVVASISLLLTFSTFLALILYLFKKVYYRGEVFVKHVFSSLRQGFLFSLLFLGIIVFNKIGVLTYITGGLLFIIFLFIELLFKSNSN